MTKELLGSHPFEVAARLPLQLGRDSIASSTAAITELIKNSYDANAENVRITFQNKSAPVARLQIEDDGDGMDEETLVREWLKIGTENKSVIERSERKSRVFTGAKGLGRLGIDRLCKRAIIQTKTAEMDYVLELHINWRGYSKRDATLSGVKHRLFRTPFLPETKYSDFFQSKSKGTRLLLVGLKEDWSEEKFSSLRNELSLLISPFDSLGDFSIEMRTGAVSVDGVITSEKILDAANWTIEAKIGADNSVSTTYIHQPSGDKYQSSAQDWKTWMPNRASIPRCGPLSLKIYYVPQPDKTVAKELSRKSWSTFMNLQHGIRIYRDRFRVRPYGEPSGRGDWLDLGIRKASSPGGIRQGGWRVGPKQVVGAIFISRIENPTLQDQANREAMVESDAFFDLRAFVVKVISDFEVLATEQARSATSDTPVEEVTRQLEESISKSQSAVDDLTAAFEGEIVPTQSEVNLKILEVNRLVEETKQASERYKEAYESQRVELEREKDTLANLASLGILTVCFGHEAREYCNLAATAAIELKESFQAGKFMILPEVEADLTEDIETIIASTHFINNFAAFSLSSVSKGKRIKGDVDISSVIRKVTSALRESLDRQKIAVDLSKVQESVVLSRVYEIDWESIFVNMLSNSIWAMAKTPAAQRRIEIEIQSTGSFAEVRFRDSGCGLEEGTEDFIFNPMYSTRRDERGNVVGTGMGLSIVKMFVNEHTTGSVRAVAKGPIGGAEFIIRIEQ
ncbi:sensor histidine kinase [Roseateles chitinivorans]|uniref:sensor histidine kinase n=1 Tax=Roseateles chitinivorans TaxID=2917965 RepID=UPI003D6691FF